MRWPWSRHTIKVCYYPDDGYRSIPRTYDARWTVYGPVPYAIVMGRKLQVSVYRNPYDGKYVKVLQHTDDTEEDIATASAMATEEVLQLLQTHSAPLEAYEKVFVNPTTARFYFYCAPDYVDGLSRAELERRSM